MASDERSELAGRYAPVSDLVPRVKAALEAVGLDLDDLSPSDLAPLDQFHSRGMLATEELAKLAEISSKDRVLDVGCGIGGPARHLVEAHGCNVLGFDLTAPYIALAEYLTNLTGLAERARFQVGNALHLPVRDASFDVVWTQHVAMNISDRTQLYREMARVLRPGGRLAVFDVVEGNGEPLQFPVPWADHASQSFLMTAGSMRSLLETSGFVVHTWRDATEAATQWFKARLAASVEAKGPPALGLHLLLGPRMGEMTSNFTANAIEGRVGFVMAVLYRA